MRENGSTSETRHGLDVNTILPDAGNSVCILIKIYRFFHEYYLDPLIGKLSVLRETFWSFTAIVTRSDCHDYIDKIWNLHNLAIYIKIKFLNKHIFSKKQLY